MQSIKNKALSGLVMLGVMGAIMVSFWSCALVVQALWGWMQ